VNSIRRRWRPVSVLAILAISAFSLVSASGLWSVTQTVAGNTVQAGTISLQLNSKVNKPLADTAIIGGVGGLLPGESTATGQVELYNNGSREQKQFLHLENVTGGLCGDITLTVGRSWTGNTLAFDENVGTFSLAAITGSGNRIEVGRDFGSGYVPANFTTVLVQKANLSATADQANMGQSCTWDEVFTAEQVAP
jgi:hypothetical protein